MFGNKKDNPFISRMNSNEQKSLQGSPYNRGCADAIVPLITDFYKKLKKSKIKWEGSIAWNIERLGELAGHVTLNTQAHEVLVGEDMQSVNEIFSELYALYDEAMELDYSSKEKSEAFASKLQCLDEIACKNMVGMMGGQNADDYVADPNANIHAGKIFQSYANLLLVLRTVNRNWSEICNRGFSLWNIFYPFRETIEYNRYKGKEPSESEKISMFLGLLDGTMKYHPQYEYKAVAYQVVPADFEETLVTNIESRFDKGFQMQPK